MSAVASRVAALAAVSAMSVVWAQPASTFSHRGHRFRVGDVLVVDGETKALISVPIGHAHRRAASGAGLTLVVAVEGPRVTTVTVDAETDQGRTVAPPPCLESLARAEWDALLPKARFGFRRGDLLVSNLTCSRFRRVARARAVGGRRTGVLLWLVTGETATHLLVRGPRSYGVQDRGTNREAGCLLVSR